MLTAFTRGRSQLRGEPAAVPVGGDFRGSKLPQSDSDGKPPHSYRPATLSPAFVSHGL